MQLRARDGVQERSVSDCVNQNLTLWETFKEKATVSSPPWLAVNCHSWKQLRYDLLMTYCSVVPVQEAAHLRGTIDTPKSLKSHFVQRWGLQLLVI